MSIASAQSVSVIPARSRHSGAMRLAPIANAIPSRWATPGEFPGEVAGINPYGHLAARPRGSGQGTQRPAQQGRDVAAGIVVAGQ